MCDHLLFPIEAHAVKQGDVILIKEFPCKIVEVKHSKTGKHGHMKCCFVGISEWDGRKHTDMRAGHQQVQGVTIIKKEYLLTFVEDGVLDLLTENNESVQESVAVDDPAYQNLVDKYQTSQETDKQVYVTIATMPVRGKVCTKVVDAKFKDD